MKEDAKINRVLREFWAGNINPPDSNYPMKPSVPLKGQSQHAHPIPGQWFEWQWKDKKADGIS